MYVASSCMTGEISVLLPVFDAGNSFCFTDVESSGMWRGQVVRRDSNMRLLEDRMPRAPLLEYALHSRGLSENETSCSSSGATRLKKALVGIAMGSQSDWNVMQHAAQQLEDFGVPFEARIVSAHRT